MFIPSLEKHQIVLNFVTKKSKVFVKKMKVIGTKIKFLNL